MPHSFFKLFFILLVASVSAAPLQKLEGRTINTSSHCGQWDSVNAGPYSLCLDQWGKKDASSGESCAQFTALSGTNVAWKTTWNWAGDYNIKSFTNIQLNDGLNKRLSGIKSMPAIWDWSQSTSGYVMGDIAFDLFTSTTPGGQNLNEIMIWLANFNSGPISRAYNAHGTAQSVASKISLAGYSWDLYSGWNGANQVYSFLPSNGAAITSFKGDLNKFLKYLTPHHDVSTSEFLRTAQGGTEATMGSATLTTSKYSLVIN